MSTAVSDTVLSALARLGFNETETLVYCELLGSPGSTGYALAQALGKARANVYQALSGLTRKGAAVFDDAQSRSYRATPPAELIDRLRRDFDQQLEEAELFLAGLQVQGPEESRFYQLKNAEQTFERARIMLRQARETILFELSPSPMAELRPDLEAARDRGVRLAGTVLRPEDVIPGARGGVSRIADRIDRLWAYALLIVITDASETLIAVLELEGGALRHALWTDSAFLSTILHNTLAANVVLHGDPLIERIQSTNKALFGIFPPGARALLADDQV